MQLGGRADAGGLVQQRLDLLGGDRVLGLFVELLSLLIKHKRFFLTRRHIIVSVVS